MAAGFLVATGAMPVSEPPENLPTTTSVLVAPVDACRQTTRKFDGAAESAVAVPFGRTSAPAKYRSMVSAPAFTVGSTFLQTLVSRLSNTVVSCAVAPLTSSVLLAATGAPGACVGAANT